MTTRHRRPWARVSYQRPEMLISEWRHAHYRDEIEEGQVNNL